MRRRIHQLLFKKAGRMKLENRNVSTTSVVRRMLGPMIKEIVSEHSVNNNKMGADSAWVYHR